MQLRAVVFAAALDLDEDTGCRTPGEELVTAVRCASNPNPDVPCLSVETQKLLMYRLHAWGICFA